MKTWTKRILAGLICAAMLLPAAVAAEEKSPAPQEPSAWTYSALADSYALGILDNNYATYIRSALTTEQLETMTTVAADKLALLNVPARPAAEGERALVVDTTRGGVMNALYQEAAAYQFEGVEQGMEAFLAGLGVVQGGGGSDLALARPCTYEEAMVMTQRLILALYDKLDAGSKGLLWKATNGENTLYLLGTIHVDRSNAYPLHRSVRDAIDASQTVIFEIDFNDAVGMKEFTDIQTYSDGTTLKDHISPALYARVVRALASLGMSEEQVAVYKPWALASTFTVLGMQDDSTSANATAIDTYVNSRAGNAGKKITAVETPIFQGKMFDTLSAEYQEDYLGSALAIYEGGLADNTSTAEEVAAAEQTEQVIAAMFDAWKSRDPKAFETAYNKTAIMQSGDELNVKLFADRDPNMIKAAAGYLELEGTNTSFMAVGAGHMVDPGGIVGGLKALGYTVELAA